MKGTTTCQVIQGDCRQLHRCLWSDRNQSFSFGSGKDDTQSGIVDYELSHNNALICITQSINFPTIIYSFCIKSLTFSLIFWQHNNSEKNIIPDNIQNI